MREAQGEAKAARNKETVATRVNHRCLAFRGSAHALVLLCGDVIWSGLVVVWAHADPECPCLMLMFCEIICVRQNTRIWLCAQGRPRCQGCSPVPRTAYQELSGCMLRWGAPGPPAETPTQQLHLWTWNSWRTSGGTDLGVASVSHGPR